MLKILQLDCLVMLQWQKSNFMAYNIHAVWQQEVWAAVERSRKYIDHYLDGLVEAQAVEGAEVLLVASGSAAAQSREAVRQCKKKKGLRQD